MPEFDPEGLLSSLMAAVTCFVGLQFGHVILYNQHHVQRLILWAILSLLLFILGYALDLVGIPLCKPLYTLSYVFVTAGVAGLLLTLIYYTVDIKQWRKPFVWLQWMGMNALVIYAFAAYHLFPEALQGFYWRSPENNLVDVTDRVLQYLFRSEKWGTLVFVMVEILLWAVVAGVLHMQGVVRIGTVEQNNLTMFIGQQTNQGREEGPEESQTFPGCDKICSSLSHDASTGKGSGRLNRNPNQKDDNPTWDGFVPCSHRPYVSESVRFENAPPGNTLF